MHISLAQAQKNPYFNELVDQMKQNLADIGSTINDNTKNPEGSGLPQDANS